MQQRNMIAVALSLAMTTATAQPDNVVNVTFKGNTVEVTGVQPTDSITVNTNGADVEMENTATQTPVTIKVKGESNNGHLVLKTKVKDKIELAGVRLRSDDKDPPLYIKNKKKVKVKALKNTDNVFTTTACRDTVNNIGAVIYAKGKLVPLGNRQIDMPCRG